VSFKVEKSLDSSDRFKDSSFSVNQA